MTKKDLIEFEKRMKQRDAAQKQNVMKAHKSEFMEKFKKNNIIIHRRDNKGESNSDNQESNSDNHLITSGPGSEPNNGDKQEASRLILPPGLAMQKYKIEVIRKHKNKALVMAGERLHLVVIVGIEEITDDIVHNFFDKIEMNIHPNTPSIWDSPPLMLSVPGSQNQGVPVVAVPVVGFAMKMETRQQEEDKEASKLEQAEKEGENEQKQEAVERAVKQADTSEQTESFEPEPDPNPPLKIA